jgi:hypothetical protein
VVFVKFHMQRSAAREDLFAISVPAVDLPMDAPRSICAPATHCAPDKPIGAKNANLA